MGRPANVSTDRGLTVEWWYGVAGGAAVWALLMATTDHEGLLGPHLYDTITLLALPAWPLIPVSMYLDLRRIRDGVAWEPATKSWLLAALVPIANVPAGAAYCLRRYYAVRGELPSANWRYGVYAGVLAWVGLLVADVAIDHVPFGPFEPIVFGPILFLVWLGYPVAVYLDAVRYSGYPDKRPRYRGLVVLSAVPLLNVLVGGAYAVGRWWHRRTLDPGVAPTAPGTGTGDAGRSEPISPWYRRAAAVFLVYFLVVAVLGPRLPLESDLAWDVLALVVWPPFGLAFVACFHLDNRALRETGVPWGDTRYLYYLSALVPAPAFWYLLSRLSKVQRSRSMGLLEDGNGREEDGVRGDDGQGDGGGSEADSDRPPGERGTTSVPQEPPDADGVDVDGGTGFEWGGGSRG